MIRAYVRHLLAHHSSLSTSVIGSKEGSRYFAALPQAVREDADSQNSTSQATHRKPQVKALNDMDTDTDTDSVRGTLCLPEAHSPKTQLDLTQTYIKRHEGEHFDTIIDPQFPAQTGLPMTVYVSQKQDSRPASVEVSQFYGNHHSLTDIFTITIPRRNGETCRIIGDTGMIRVNDIVKVCKYICRNRKLLHDVWEHGEDSSNEVVWHYYKYLKRL